MIPMSPTIRTPAEGRTVAVVGDVYRFLATGKDTNGKFSVWVAATVLPARDVSG